MILYVTNRMGKHIEVYYKVNTRSALAKVLDKDWLLVQGDIYYVKDVRAKVDDSSREILTGVGSMVGGGAIGYALFWGLIGAIAPPVAIAIGVLGGGSMIGVAAVSGKVENDDEQKADFFNKS